MHKLLLNPVFDHYPELPVVEKDGVEFTILVGEFLNTTSPVSVYTRAVRSGLKRNRKHQNPFNTQSKL